MRPRNPGKKGVRAALRHPKTGDDLLILCYHGISDSWEDPLGVTTARFEEQLAELKRLGYLGITFSEAALRPPRGRTVAITFDDAYLSVFERARGLLGQYGFPATVFVPTAFPGQDDPMAWDGIDHWRGTPDAHELVPMRWDQLRELASIGWEIGSHTVDHPKLAQLADGELAWQLTESKVTIESELGVECRSIAYPYGDTDDRVARVAAESGYACAAALPEGRWRHRDRYQVPRVGIYRADVPASFGRKISRLSRSLRRSRLWPAVSRARLALLGRG